MLLAVVFGVWYARERTLSIHTIVTTPREAWYWLTVLVTFALGTAAGDWTLELTGWSPGQRSCCPLGLIVAVLVAWKLGAGPVLSLLARLHPHPSAGRQHRRLPRLAPSATAAWAWAPSAPACCSSAPSC